MMFLPSRSIDPVEEGSLKDISRPMDVGCSVQAGCSAEAACSVEIGSLSASGHAFALLLTKDVGSSGKLGLAIACELLCKSVQRGGLQDMRTGISRG